MVILHMMAVLLKKDNARWLSIVHRALVNISEYSVQLRMTVPRLILTRLFKPEFGADLSDNPADTICTVR